jgi:hypothetical protein
MKRDSRQVREFSFVNLDPKLPSSDVLAKMRICGRA